MAYEKQTWTDRVVEFARRFTYTQDETHITLTPEPGTVTEAGTPVDASRLNHIEDGIADIDANLNLVQSMFSEGEWTPTIAGANYSKREGWYNVIGNTVFAYFYIVLSSKGSMINANIDGLPFTSSSAIARAVSLSRVENYSSEVKNVYANVAPSGNSISVRGTEVSGTVTLLPSRLYDNFIIGGVAIYQK